MHGEGKTAKSKFPRSIGLTGEVIRNKGIFKSEDLESEPQFIEDIDNVLKTKPLRNMIIFEVGAEDINPGV